ncbi:MFS transporter [soil metagenome]
MNTNDVLGRNRRAIDPTRSRANLRKLVAAVTVSNFGDGISLLAYPWLASAITRNPLLIALVAVSQRLPALLFSLPAGVAADRYDRRRLMIGANVIRTALTLGVAAVILTRRSGLPGPDEVTEFVSTDSVLYMTLIVATLLLGIAEVVYDTSAQAFLPLIVADDDLERANGRLLAAEIVSNQFIGPPVGSALLAVGAALPFIVDGATFAVSAALMALVVTLPRTMAPPNAATSATLTPAPSWRSEMKAGIQWLWRHKPLRDIALIVAALNLFHILTMAAYVLFAQEVLGTSAFHFALIGATGAAGALLGGWAAPRIRLRLGRSGAIRLVLLGASAFSFVVGVSSSWVLAAAMFAVADFLSVVLNVVTISYRQQLVPDALLARVNSVYRVMVGGVLPIGLVLGGLLMAAVEPLTSRTTALRSPWIVAGFGELAVLLVAWRRLQHIDHDVDTGSSPDGMAITPPVQ